MRCIFDIFQVVTIVAVWCCPTQLLHDQLNVAPKDLVSILPMVGPIVGTVAMAGGGLGLWDITTKLAKLDAKMDIVKA